MLTSTREVIFLHPVNGGNSGLIWAAIRCRRQILEELLRRGADITVTDELGFTALDHAVINGNYDEALILKRAVIFILPQGLRPKSADFYALKEERFVNFRVNVPQFLERLALEAPDNPEIFEKKPPKRPKLNDPVVDPRESWGEMFWRVSEFRPPPLVERSTLPPELQTKNTVYDKLSKMINNKYIEKHERKDKIEKLDSGANPAVLHEATNLKGDPTPDSSLGKIKRREKSFDKTPRGDSNPATPRQPAAEPRLDQEKVSVALELGATHKAHQSQLEHTDQQEA